MWLAIKVRTLHLYNKTSDAYMVHFTDKYYICTEARAIYEVCLKSIGTVCFAQTTLATVIKALFFKMAQCLVVVKM